MKSNTQSFELTAVQLWLLKLRSRIALPSLRVRRTGQPSIRTWMRPPKATL